MPTAVFQGFYDVTIATKITGYANRTVAAAGFNRGCFWPQFSGTQYKLVGGFTKLTGGFCDIVSLNPAAPDGPGLMTLTDWGDLTPTPAAGNTCPGYYGVGIEGNVYGMGFYKRSAGPSGDTVAQSYSYPVTLGVNLSQPGLVLTTLLEGDLLIPYMVQAGFVFMRDFDRISTFYVTGHPIIFDDYQFEINNLGNISEGLPFPSDPFALYGAWPGTNYVLHGEGGELGLLDMSIPLFTPTPVTWDNGDINTILTGTGTSLSFNSTITRLGYLTFCLATVTVGSRTLTNFCVLTSYDGTKYWVIAMTAGDANAVLALGGIGSNRTAHLTPGTFWFRNPLNGAITDKVFAGAFPSKRRFVSAMGSISTAEG